jgi:hypothetical protein
MFTQTPPWFHEVAMGMMDDLGLRFDNISTGSVWIASEYMLPFIKNTFPDEAKLPSCNWPPSPSHESSENDQPSASNAY